MNRLFRFLKSYFFPLILFAGAVLLFLNKEQLVDIGRVLSNIQPLWLLAAVGLQVITYALEARAYNSVLRLWGYRAYLLPMMRHIVVSRFIGRSVPSLSLAGHVYVAKQFHEGGLTKNDAIQTNLRVTIDYYLSILLFASLSYIYLWLTNQLHFIQIIFFAVFTGLAIALFVLGIFGARRHGRLGIYYEKMISKFRSLGGAMPEEGADADNGDRGSEVDTVPLFTPATLFWQVARFLVESLTVYVIFHGFGVPIHFSIATVGFSVATIIGLVSVFPGGLGQFEGAQILVFASLGIAASEAIAVTLIYRLLSFWLPLPLGAFFYKYEKQSKSVLLHSLRERNDV